MAPGVTPNAVPAVALVATLAATPDAIPIAMLDVVHVLAPCVAYHVAHGGARAIAHGGAHGVPQGRARHATHVLAPHATPGGVGPTMDPSVAPILGQATPTTLVGGLVAPPPHIDINALFIFSELEVARLQ